MKRFLHDTSGPIQSIPLDYLKLQVGSGNILESYSTPGQDKYPFQIYNIITGPLILNVIKHNKLEFPHYQDVKTLYDYVLQIDRKDLATKIQSSVYQIQPMN